MKFVELPRVYSDQPLFGAAKGAFTFIISEDEDCFTASAKVRGSTQFDGSRHDLGAHKTFTAATQACEDFYRNRNA